MTADRRLLFVHAHPDDEAIPTGVTMAKYAAEGAAVTLVTCTLGEEGEVVAADLGHLASMNEDRLGEHRINELREACDILGVQDVRILGGQGRWRDSGMENTPTNDHPRAFWQADLDEAVEALVEVIRETRPQVVVTYNERGDYGHPDHIQAHRVAVGAVDAARDAARCPGAGAPWDVAKLYYTAIPKSLLQLGMDYFKAAGEPGIFEGVTSVDDLPFGTPDELVTTRVLARDRTEQKLAALRAHRSQVAENSEFFALPPELAPLFWGAEHYQLVRGPRGPADEDGYEPDLFAAL